MNNLTNLFLGLATIANHPFLSLGIFFATAVLCGLVLAALIVLSFLLLCAVFRKVRQYTYGFWHRSVRGPLTVMYAAVSLIFLALLSACAPTTVTADLAKMQTAVNAAYSDGQLFCGFVTSAGMPIVAGIIDASAAIAGGPVLGGVALLVTNRTSAFVNASCAVAGAAQGLATIGPVVPPAVPTQVPAIAIVPPSV